MSHCKPGISFKMTRTVLYFLTVFLVLSSSVEGWSRKEGSSRGGRSYSEQQQKSVDAESSQKNVSASTTKSSGGGIGAWGYVAIILTLIAAGLGCYYFTLFYPILCKKERKYDVMELGAVNV